MAEIANEVKIPRSISGIKLIQNGESSTPRREENTIVLPPTEEIDAFSLIAKGKKFLLDCDAGYFFGGKDEAPFVVQIESEAYSEFRQNGEEAFFDYLKPELIKLIETVFKRKAKRQGEIWAVPLGQLGTEQASALIKAFSGGEEEMVEVEGFIVVFDTGHCLTGKRYDSADYSYNDRTVAGLIAEGTLTAPDHKPLELKGPHLLLLNCGMEGID